MCDPLTAQKTEWRHFGRLFSISPTSSGARKSSFTAYSVTAIDYRVLYTRYESCQSEPSSSRGITRDKQEFHIVSSIKKATSRNEESLIDLIQKFHAMALEQRRNQIFQ